MGDSTGIGKLSCTFQAIGENLGASFAFVLKGETHCSTRIYFHDAPRLPPVVTCFAACTDNEVAKELHDKIVDLLRSYFPTLPTKSTPDQVN
jgi:hypothetical protein